METVCQECSSQQRESIPAALPAPSHTPNVALPRYAQRCKNCCEQLIRINAIGDIWFSFHFSVLLVLIGTRLRNAANPFEVECIVRLEALWALLMTLCVTFHLNIHNARNEKGLLKKRRLVYWKSCCWHFSIHFTKMLTISYSFQAKPKFFNISSFFNFF